MHGDVLELERSKTSRAPVVFGHSETADRGHEWYFAKITTGNIFIVHTPLQAAMHVSRASAS